MSIDWSAEVLVHAIAVEREAARRPVGVQDAVDEDQVKGLPLQQAPGLDGRGGRDHFRVKVLADGPADGAVVGETLADAQDAVIQTTGQQAEAVRGAIGDRQAAKRTRKQS